MRVIKIGRDLYSQEGGSASVQTALLLTVPNSIRLLAGAVYNFCLFLALNFKSTPAAQVPGYCGADILPAAAATTTKAAAGRTATAKATATAAAAAG